jgi:hypothetical protein
MSAVVVFSEGDDWFTNSYTWRNVLAYSMEKLDEARRSDYEWHMDGVGIDFTLMSAEVAVEVASWFAATIEGMFADPSTNPDWVEGSDRQHFFDLISKLRAEVLRRDPARSTE